MTTHSDALRNWFVPAAAIAAALIALMVLLRMAGILSAQPLEETRLVFSIKWGLIIAFILQMVLVWRGHRSYTVTAASLANIPEPGSPNLPEQLRSLDREHLIASVVSARIKARCAFMLGNVTGALAMLAGLYVITTSAWYLLAIAAYAGFSAWMFRPIDSQ